MRLDLRPARLDALGVIAEGPEGEPVVIVSAHKVDGAYRARRLSDGASVRLAAATRTAGTLSQYRASGRALPVWLRAHGWPVPVPSTRA